MTSEPASSKNALGIPRMLLYREGTNNRAVALGQGMTIEEYIDRDGKALVSITVQTGGTSYSHFRVEAFPRDIEPQLQHISLFDKLRLRFAAAAANDTDVDLRFCTGDISTRKPEQDNLRPGYKSNSFTLG